MKLRYRSASHAYYLDGKRLRGASSVAKVPDDSYHLSQWRLRTALIGAAANPHILTAVAGDHDNKDKLNELVEEAIRLGKGNTGRDYGTAVHRVIERLNTGDTLLETPEVAKLREQWNKLLAAEGLEVVATEGAVLDPERRYSGRFDVKVCKLDTGTVHIGDVKTGADADKYLHAHSVQLHLYASAPYLAKGIPLGDVDFETEEFEPQTGVDQSVGYVFHLPLEGEPSAIPVDISAGAWCMANVIEPTWTWRNRNDLRVDVTPKKTRPRRITPLADASRAVTEAQTAPDEGLELDKGDPAVVAVRGPYMALREAGGDAWINALRADALAAGVDFHLSGKLTLRRARIMAGLVALTVAEVADDDVLKALVRHVTGHDAMTWPTISAGAAVGSLGATDAALFVAACDAFVAGRFELVYDGGPALKEVA
jgi:hypothetical protein